MDAGFPALSTRLRSLLSNMLVADHPFRIQGTVFPAHDHPVIYELCQGFTSVSTTKEPGDMYVG